MSQRYFYDKFVCDLDDNLENSSNEDIVLNCKYRDELQDLHQQEGNHIDAYNMYKRTWLQTCNLIVGCVVLGVFIYRHK